MILDHCANRITKGTVGLIEKLFVEELGFRLLRGLPDEIWLRQGDANVDIQFCETNEQPISDHDKQNSHIAFISDKPREELEKLATWFKERGYKCLGDYFKFLISMDSPDFLLFTPLKGALKYSLIKGKVMFF